VFVALRSLAQHAGENCTAQAPPAKRAASEQAYEFLVLQCDVTHDHLLDCMPIEMSEASSRDASAAGQSPTSSLQSPTGRAASRLGAGVPRTLDQCLEDNATQNIAAEQVAGCTSFD